MIHILYNLNSDALKGSSFLQTSFASMSMVKNSDIKYILSKNLSLYMVFICLVLRVLVILLLNNNLFFFNETFQKEN